MIVGLDTGVLVAASIGDHPDHDAARQTLDRLRVSNDLLAVAPQVLTEFIHVVTDQRRFNTPLTVSSAIALAEELWTTGETYRALTGSRAIRQFSIWMTQFRLGRKRVLDTMLAATYFQANITTILTTNPADFSVSGVFTCRLPTPDPWKDNSC